LFSRRQAVVGSVGSISAFDECVHTMAVQPKEFLR
jgi:hypothetical protein